MTFINLYAPNIEVPEYIKQILRDLKGEIDSNTTIVGDFNTHLHQWIDHPDRKISKKTLALNNTLDQMDNRYI